MPNTLVHIGVQGIVNRALSPSADFRWIFLACVIPDIPWIFQRVVHFVAPGIDPLLLREYAIIQASLAVSLLLCGAVALLSARPRVVLAVLAVNVLFHLLLDACETKWANGVHLFAPLSWELLGFGWFWPESLPVYAGTALGVVVGALAIWRPVSSPVPFRFKSGTLPAVVLLLTYLLLPIALMDGPAAADNHSIATLRDRLQRPGRSVEFDRNQLVRENGQLRLLAWTGEKLRVSGHDELVTGTVSVRGTFSEMDLVDVKEIHYHKVWFRDGASYAGLALVAVVWVAWLLQANTREKHNGE